MGIKADRWIKRMAVEHGMIEPFVDRQARAGVVSFGLSSYGYDTRAGMGDAGRRDQRGGTRAGA